MKKRKRRREKRRVKCWCVPMCCAESCLTLCDPMDCIACQAPLSMRFSRQEYWSGLPFPSPGDLPHPGLEPTSPALAGGFFTTVLPNQIKAPGWITNSSDLQGQHPGGVHTAVSASGHTPGPPVAQLLSHIWASYKCTRSATQNSPYGDTVSMSISAKKPSTSIYSGQLVTELLWVNRWTHWGVYLRWLWLNSTQCKISDFKNSKEEAFCKHLFQPAVR